MKGKEEKGREKKKEEKKAEEEKTEGSCKQTPLNRSIANAVEC